MTLAVLKDSKTLYESVPGTSASSVYRVIMLLDGAAMAARVQGGTLSLRVEGDNAGDYVTSLSKLGFSSKGGHTSIHLTIASLDDGRKMIGACAAMIGWPNVLTVGELEKIA